MKISIFFILFIFFASCNLTKNKFVDIYLDRSNCYQENIYNYSKNDIAKPLNIKEVDLELKSVLNINNINIAYSIGILDLVKKYIEKVNLAKIDTSYHTKIELVNLRQELNNKIDLISLEISSVAAELNCEEERINQIASFLKEKEMRKETRLTVSSIILGSMTAIVTGILVSSNDKSNLSDILGVSVGIVDAFFGVRILSNKSKIELKHSRNVLREIWLATETSTVYPPSIWYYLNYSKPDENDKISLREQLIENWKSFGQISNSKNKNNSLEIYFNEKGIYSVDQLENRANMYDQIESIIKLMKQDLRNLTLSLDKLR